MHSILADIQNNINDEWSGIVATNIMYIFVSDKCLLTNSVAQCPLMCSGCIRSKLQILLKLTNREVTVSIYKHGGRELGYYGNQY